MTSYKLKETKTCSCGKTHTETGVDYKISFDELFAGFYFNCECKSTLFVKPTGVVKSEEQSLQAA